MTNWKSIDTCPDNKPVLVTGKSQIYVAIIHRNLSFNWYSLAGVNGSSWDTGVHFYELTHWMPLPLLPEIEK